MRTFGLGWGMAVSIFLMGCLPGKVVAQGENQSWTGAVAIESVAADQILIAVDTLNEGRPLDGIVDRVFWYTAQAPLDSWLSYKFDHANLELGAGALRVTSPDEPGTVFLFSVRERRERPATGNRPNVFANGVALATYTMGPDSGSLENLKSIIEAIDTEYQDYTSGGSSGGTLCTAGGTGSTSCSISCSGLSCSVTCGMGYSCCSCSGSTPSCRCK